MVALHLRIGIWTLDIIILELSLCGSSKLSKYFISSQSNSWFYFTNSADWKMTSLDYYLFGY